MWSLRRLVVINLAYTKNQKPFMRAIQKTLKNDSQKAKVVELGNINLPALHGKFCLSCVLIPSPQPPVTINKAFQQILAQILYNVTREGSLMLLTGSLHQKVLKGNQVRLVIFHISN